MKSVNIIIGTLYIRFQRCHRAAVISCNLTSLVRDNRQSCAESRSFITVLGRYLPKPVLTP